MAQALTRSQTLHYVFGPCKSMPSTQLPTQVDVIRYQYFLRMQQNKQRTSPLDHIDTITEALLGIWGRAFIPALQENLIRNRLRKCIF